MKTDNEIDLPNPPQGYKWVFDAALDDGFGCSIKAVRIITHRADGTPLSIDPLPEVEGYRVEYKGVCITPDHVTDEVLIYDHVNKIWIRYPSVWQPNEVINSHWCNLYKIAQPTTLADLVGKHGQNNVWLHTETNGSISSAIDCRDGKIHYVDGKTIECLIKYAYRWSNSPFTKYEDANEFVPE